MKKLKRKLGFTLIEVMTVLTILAVAMLSFIPMVISTMRANTFGSRMTRSTELAQEQLEIIRRIPFDDPSITPGAYPFTSATTTFDTIFQRKYTVDLVGGDPDIKLVSVSVDWKASGVPQNTTYVTIKVRYEL